MGRAACRPLVATGLTLFLRHGLCDLWAGLTRASTTSGWRRATCGAPISTRWLSSTASEFWLRAYRDPGRSRPDRRHRQRAPSRGGPNFAAFATPTGWVLLGPSSCSSPRCLSSPRTRWPSGGGSLGADGSPLHRRSRPPGERDGEMGPSRGRGRRRLASSPPSPSTPSACRARGGSSVRPSRSSRWHCWRCQHCSRWWACGGEPGPSVRRRFAPWHRRRALAPGLALDWSQLSDWLTISPTTSGSTIRRRGPRSPHDSSSRVSRRCRRSQPGRRHRRGGGGELRALPAHDHPPARRAGLAVAFAARVASEAVLDAYYTCPS